MNSPGAPTGHEIALRDLRADDDDFLYHVYAGTRTEELAPLGWSEAQLEAFLRMQHAAQRSDYWLNYDTSRFRIITCDGIDAGRLYVERRHDELCIVDIALLAHYRARGIGSLLVSQLVAEADDDDLVVRIHVEHENPAQRLYLRHGFVFCDESTGPIYRLMERLPRIRDASRAA